ncbi:hypothetical protein GGR51DRAFT_555127 [Nemania sp. FL0031]|nr:hypothetical protein GGR51DRAFT_555127 [Nemania sp. FL0031]
MSPITRCISSISSALKRIHGVARKDQTLPEDSPPPYESIDFNPIVRPPEFRYIGQTAAFKGALEALKCRKKCSREALMSGIISAFEVAMEKAITQIGSFASDSAKCAALIAATTASLAGIRGYGLIVLDSTDIVDNFLDVVDDATLDGMDAGRAALSGAYQQDVGPISHAEMDLVLRRVAWKATTTAFRDVFFEDAATSCIIIGIADALGASIRAGIDSGVPFNHSAAVTKAAITAAIAASRSAIKISPSTSGDAWCRARQWIVEAEKKAIKVGVKAGKAALPPNASI